MKTNRSIFMIAIALIALGIVSIALQPVVDPRPDSVCVADNAPSSGFMDEDKDCPISQGSYEKIADWDSSAKPLRIIGLVLILGGVVTGIVGFVRRNRRNDPPSGIAPA